MDSRELRGRTDPAGCRTALLNSTTTAILSTVLSLVLAVPAAYAVTRFGTPSGRVFIFIALISRMVPLIAVGAPLVSVMRNLGLSDTTLGLAIAHTTISLPLSIWLMASFFEAVPSELDEAARVDGSNEFQLYRRVIMPLLWPVTLAAVIILGHSSLKVFDLIIAMAGKQVALDVPAIYMWTTTFDGFFFGRGAAIGIVLLVSVAILVIPYLWYSLRQEAG